jgi:hypothetical protein
VTAPPNPTGPVTPRPRRPVPRATVVTVAALLIVPVLALLLVPTYAREDPHLLGFPFFYWWQLLWMFIEAVMVYTAYRLLLRARGEDPRR